MKYYIPGHINILKVNNETDGEIIFLDEQQPFSVYIESCSFLRLTL